MFDTGTCTGTCTGTGTGTGTCTGTGTGTGTCTGTGTGTGTGTNCIQNHLYWKHHYINVNIFEKGCVLIKYHMYICTMYR